MAAPQKSGLVTPVTEALQNASSVTNDAQPVTSVTNQAQGRDNRDKHRELTKDIVVEWISDPDNVPEGVSFSSEMIRKGLRVESDKGKATLRQILNRLCKDKVPLIKHSRNKDGVFERVDDGVPIMDWSHADDPPLPILWPFDLHKYISVFPGLALLAGSSDAGKTAFALNMAAMNSFPWQGRMKVYTQEGGPQMLARRLRALRVDVPPPFPVIDRTEKLEDVIGADDLSIVDYLPIPQEVYTLQAQVDAIYRKIKTGFALINLQKPKGRDDAFGGFMLRGRAQVYLSMESDKLKVVKCKERVDPQKNPIDKEWQFWIENGIHIRYLDPFTGKEMQ